MNRSGARSFGRGRGMGGGRSIRRGRGITGGMMSVPQTTQSPPISGITQQPFIKTTPGEELPTLKAQARDLERQLQAINARIRELEEAGRDFARIAFVDSDRCTACGVCVEVCPNGAISIGEIACIDQRKCIGCGRCIAECPQSALSLRKA